MSASERLGLRLRDVHPGCGGGVVVVGFEPKSPAKRAGIQQGDRITRVDGEPRRWSNPTIGCTPFFSTRDPLFEVGNNSFMKTSTQFHVQIGNKTRTTELTR